ncbi:HAD-superfamily hydrolase [Eremomyces bilateralis CBS 781.70]|uniref:HAD-superfamily hydrolase n=1 Tax=Eremomyces bilateralis CBS 781.70 TaxID=1392243 RepID=A0A6G1GEY9_9PEZI|nr:HAD-superfamily hydrolase [Eremomyces bilateralis CBS 781.70]KAF1816439.1 HAD-superfamily hydrolase [Eremomyces bilateralis CBS 781.70]
MPKITTVLFDCDNTLVLSEVLAFEACADLANEILEKKGNPKRYTGPELLKDFVGQNFRGMMVGLMGKFDITLTDAELDEYVEKELQAVVKKLEAKAEPCIGAMDEVDALHKEGKYKMAVVSSSALSRVKASLDKVGMDKFFRPDWVYSAATSLEKPTSKPNPAVYLFACKQIGVNPGECVAIEDSKSGATAAKNAGIPLIGYVGPYEDDEIEEKTKMLKEECGAIVVMKHWSEFRDCLKKVEEAPAVSSV